MSRSHTLPPEALRDAMGAAHDESRHVRGEARRLIDESTQVVARSRAIRASLAPRGLGRRDARRHAG